MVFLVILLLSYIGNLHPMDVAAHPGETAAPKTGARAITKWPLFLFGEAFPALVGRPDETQEWVDAQLKKALTVTRETANEQHMPEIERVRLDWMYALHMVQKELLCKPIDTLAVDDIRHMASWLTRLTAQNPGCFRSHESKWPIKTDISPEDQERLTKIDALEDAEITKDDAAFLQRFFYFFVRSETIPARLEQFLEDVKRIVSLLKANPVMTEERVARLLNAASFVHLEAVAIHPFEEGSKRLARMLMYIFLAQHGLQPMTFYNSELHSEKLLMALAHKNREAFEAYVTESYIVSNRLKRNPFYFGILKDISAQKLAPPLWNKALLNHPLQIAFEKQIVTEKSKPTVQRSASVAKRCDQCGRSSEIVVNLKLQKCSGCKQAAYCSTECQKGHWPSHKAHCKKP